MLTKELRQGGEKEKGGSWSSKERRKLVQTLIKSFLLLTSRRRDGVSFYAAVERAAKEQRS